MHKTIIKQYVNKLTKEDIVNFSKKQNLFLTNDEASIIYKYIKEDWFSIIYDDPKYIFNELKSKIDSNKYCKIKDLYTSFKNKYKNYL